MKNYFEACHAMQSGVAMEMNTNPKPTEPKHLRVGINVALCSHSALVKLLEEKGILTKDEYTIAVTAELNAEVARYEEALSAQLGTKVTLG